MKKLLLIPLTVLFLIGIIQCGPINESELNLSACEARGGIVLASCGTNQESLGEIDPSMGGGSCCR